MRGKIELIKKGFGKIIFDKKESPVLSLPIEVEDGDIAEVEFENDRMDKIKRFVAYSPDKYYGNVINEFRGGGIILVTYPKLLKTIVFKGNNFKKYSKVRFTLKKSFKGMEAVDVDYTKEFYKCFLPSFGKIEKRILTPKYGVIEEVFNKDRFILEGEIKNIGNRGFGFIRSEIGDIFFFVNNFEKVFNRAPKKNEKVIFRYKNTPKGKTATNFYKSVPVLPKNKQYFILDGKKLSVSLYEKFFQKSPELGDMVYYIEENGSIRLRKNDKVIEKYIFVKDERGDFVKGKVNFINEEKKFGFIKSEIGSVYFTFRQFESFYKKAPKKGDIVKFFYVKSDKGVAVSRFLENEFEVSKKAFSNFVETNSDDYYYAYVNNNKVEEIFRYDKNDLSLSIACYKNTNNKLKKIEAIECILENEFESKNIKKEVLIKEKLKILDELVEEFIEVNKELAFEFELKRQKIEFNPKRLKKFNFEGTNFISFKEVREIENKENSINFIELKEIVEYKDEDKVCLIDENIKVSEYKEKEQSWKIIERRDYE